MVNGTSESGIVEIRSRHSVDDTVERLRALLTANGATLFALVDHSGEAAKVGMAMPPTKLLIFGNPQAGTPVMLASPTSALDLPLKILVHEDAEGRVFVSYNSAEFLARRHGIPEPLQRPLAAAEAFAKKAVE